MESKSLEKLEGGVQLPQTMGLLTFFTHPLVSTVTPCLGSRRSTSYGGDISVLSRFISAKPSRKPFIYHLLCPEKDKEGKKIENTYIPAKRTKKRKKNWNSGEALPRPNRSILSSSPRHLLQTSHPSQPLLQHGLSHLSSSSTVPKAAFRLLSRTHVPG